MLPLQKKLFIVVALILGLISMARVIPVRAETIQVEGGIAISGEFTEGSIETTPPISLVDGERTFTTSPSPKTDGPMNPVTSPETAFQTLPLPTDGNNPSEEETFPTGSQTTSEPPGGGGGGSGGGSYDYRLPVPPVPNVAKGECPIYLTKFIRLGANNDPAEVLKLQRFLRDSEQLDVPVDGIYGETTFEAVKIFQLRYADAILKPWGIDYPTGYVYITTTLAINNLYCERDPATTVDLRSRPLAPNQVEGAEVIPTTTPTSTLPLVGVATTTSRFLTAALGVLDFFKQIPAWWWIIFLLFIILFLSIALVRARRRNRWQNDLLTAEEEYASDKDG